MRYFEASQDKEAKEAWDAARKAKQIEKLKDMFLQLDEDGSGELSLEELLEAPESAQEQLKERLRKKLTQLTLERS